jgi:hypothetical protein
MKQTKRTNHGVALIYVIVLTTLVSVFMLALTEGTKSMIRQTNRAHAKAIERNLTLSALAWVKNAQASGRTPVSSSQDPQTIELDVSTLTKRASELTLFLPPSGKIQIRTTNTYGQQTLNQTLSGTLAGGNL